ncbi:hypothetical protein MPSEU_000347400 [Mayamaea pseudoterrestris]|nr:hypothetical protein MPSEU_000347400 [Mayamaea pseudoterrestris]
MFASTLFVTVTRRLALTHSSHQPVLYRMCMSTSSLSAAVVISPMSSTDDADAAVEKARKLFADYRETHYRQCLPSRFRKEVMQAAVTDPAKQADRIDMEGLRRVFANIGAINQITAAEMQLVFKELGNELGEIDVPRFKRLVCP